MTRIGLKIFYLRTREQRLSQAQLAKALGIRQATLSHVEQGISLPSCTLLLQEQMSAGSLHQHAHRGKRLGRGFRPPGDFQQGRFHW